MKKDKFDEIMSAIKMTDNLPSLPEVIYKINSLMEDDTISVNYIGNLMTKDMSLSAKILKIVNSPFYGFPQRIYNLNLALVLLGSNTLKSIIITSSVFELMKDTMKGLWEHSLFCGLTAKYIAKQINGKKQLIDEDLVFSAGLLHDIGKLIIAIKFRDDFDSIIKLAEEKKQVYSEAEKEILDISHADVGYYLTKSWNYPASIYTPIRFHHDFMMLYKNENINKNYNVKSIADNKNKAYSSNNYIIETAIVNLSDILTKSLGIGFSGSIYVDEIKNEIMEILSIDLDFLKKIIEEIYYFKDELNVFN
ncbi:MAG: HDOD domain-containing protein [Candidatus Acididesulfobacter guangdongensis]|uniref:HDOD domain-containing protein n=1 Tax=Acididesulfobacter guangdongensis TaxID=2597225 RepID=A0A519BFZ0_ACIG2|nr:MAG: HDOD domain-containing protein [Candidatus Acididesulfobacter guangdongensis]